MKSIEERLELIKEHTLSPKAKVELRGEVIEFKYTMGGWEITTIAHNREGYVYNGKYRVQTKPTENELKKISLLEKMEELKQELESLEIR